MSSSQSVQLDPCYELSIEMMSTPSIMGKYTHVLKIRYEGLAIDPGRALYLCPSKELGLTDLTGQLMWYKGGKMFTHINGVLVAQPIPFSQWLATTLADFRTFLSR